MLSSAALGEHAGLLTIDDAGAGCTFTHSITWRTLCDELGPGRRGELHLRLAQALESRGPARAEESTEQLAYHFERAEPPAPARAAHYCGLAGERALAGHDHETAAEWFERALELSRRSGVSEERERCRLLIGLGQALRTTGQPRFRTILLEAARLADEIGDVDLLTAAALANHRGFVSLVGDFDRERIAMLELAAERISDRGPELALLLAQLALELTFSPEPAERRRRLAAEALEIARETGSPLIVSRVLLRTLIASWGPGDASARVAAAAESIAISAELDDPLDLFHGLQWQAGAQIELGEIGAASRALAEQRQIAERVGDQTGAWLCECMNSVHLGLRGELAKAEAAAQRAIELAEHSAQPDGIAFYASQLASVRWQQGRLPELATLLSEAVEQHPGLPAFRSLATLANALAGHRDLAEESS